MNPVGQVRSDKPVHLRRQYATNGGTSVFDLTRCVGNQNDVIGLLDERPKALFTLAESVAFGYFQLIDMLLLLQFQKDYQRSRRCKCDSRKQLVSSSQPNTLSPLVLGFHGDLHLALHQIVLRPNFLEIDLFCLVKIASLNQYPLATGRQHVAIQNRPDLPQGRGMIVMKARGQHCSGQCLSRLPHPGVHLGRQILAP